MFHSALQKFILPKLGLFSFFFIFSGSVLFAQNVKLEGVVQDTLGEPLPNTNLIATPQTEGHETTFAIADQNGKYKLMLEKKVWYKIEINTLGFSSITDSLQLTENTQKNYTLFESHNELEQVVVKAKMAMVVKEDTITYRTDKFKTGDERKLREILKKLPGVEVDRKGNVTVNGKKVSKLMVDGQDFFGGNVKLGVNNIPADAVDEVEAIDDYHEVGFMKGLSDSNRMAMNIKLKEDKKQFVFGETEAGGGIKKRYYLHPTIFYYSPETTVNFIGSLNNVNESPLDWEDVMRYKGGYSSFLDNPVNSSDAGLSQFSNSNDILFHKTLFGAANLSQKITKDLRLEAYTIVAEQKTQSENFNHTEYLTQDNLFEDRETSRKEKGVVNFNKVRLRYKPNTQKDLAYDVIANVSNNSFNQHIDSEFADSTNLTNTLKDPHNVEISQYFRYNTQPTYAHTSEIKVNYTYKEANSLTNWDFDRPVFADIIPAIQDGERYNFLHDYSSVTNTGKFNFKHYWVLNNTNHIYPKAGIYFFHQTYNSTDYQRLQNGTVNSFASAGFDNALNYQLIDPYIGFQYKFKAGDIIFRPGLVYHHYFWRVNQFNDRLTDEGKAVLLPEFKAEYKPTTSKKLELNYNLKSTFADASDYANRLRLTSFNSLFRGNENLENSLYHALSLSFREFNLAHGINYNLRLNYTRREKSVRQTTNLEGIDRVNTSIYSHLPENSYRFSGYVNKRWRHYSIGIAGSMALSDYTRQINGNEIGYDAQAYRYRLSTRTIFKKWPNLRLGLQQTFRNSKSNRSENKYWSADPYAELDYAFLNGFIFKADYNYSYTKDNSNNQGQDFQIGNASLYYSAENSLWGFEIRADNVFDVNYKRSHYFNEFMVYDIRTYIQPRTVLFILSYQL